MTDYRIIVGEGVWKKEKGWYRMLPPMCSVYAPKHDLGVIKLNWLAYEFGGVPFLGQLEHEILHIVVAKLEGQEVSAKGEKALFEVVKPRCPRCQQICATIAVDELRAYLYCRNCQMEFKSGVEEG